MQYGNPRLHRSRLIAVYVLLVSTVLVISVLALLTVQWTMPGTGSVKGIGFGVYWDSQCTNVASAIVFGQLELGTPKSFFLYLRNEENSVFSLNMTSQNWVPVEVKNFVTITWNCEGRQVAPDEIIPCEITVLATSKPVDLDSFNVDIIISATG